MSHILVVEDDTDVREALSDALRDEGYPVQEAAHGQAALQCLEAGALPALILLDLAMPVMNGTEFRLRQLADPRLAAIPTVVLSASANIAERVAGLQVEHLVPKPVDLDVVLQLAARFVPGGAARGG